jgi:hypothetical protein
MEMRTISKNTNKKISEALAITGITLLILDTINTFSSRNGYGFLFLTDQQSGISLGIPSIIFLFICFGIGFRENSRIISTLLVFGGALLAISKIIEPSLHLNLFLAFALPYLYISLIIMGIILSGLGLIRIIKRL